MRIIKIYLILILSILIRFNSLAQCACTDVTAGANPCPPVATLYTDVNAASSAPQVKTTFAGMPFAVSGTSYVFCTKYTIPAGVTKIGVLNYMGTPNVTSFNRGNWQAFDIAGCASPISGTTATSPSGGAAEFTVTPGSTYKFCVTIDISSNYTNGTITSSEFYMYNATSTCPASVGTISVSGGTSVSATEYNLTTNGSTITISSAGSVLPSPSTVTAGSTSTYGYFIFTQLPTLPFSDVTPSGITSLPGFKGVVSGTSVTDNNSSGVSSSVAGASTLYFIPAVFDKKTGGLTLDDDGDGCYAVGTPIKVNYSVTPTPTCATCATATCTASSVTATTVATARTNLTTQLTTDGDQYNTLTVNAGKSTTVCVPVTVTAGSTILGFKQRAFGNPSGCTNPSEETITYSLTTSSCGATIPPNRTNASAVSSGFNPEWDNLTPGNYVLCYTVSVSPSALCSTYELDGIGYYNVGPPTPPCPTDKTYITLDWKQANPFVSWTGGTFNCTSPLQTIYKNVEATTISTGGQIQPFPGFKMTMSTDANSPTNTSALVSVNGVPYSYYGPTGTAPANVLDWGPMANGGNQDIMEPFLPKGATVTVQVCDKRATNQTFQDTIFDYATGVTLIKGNVVAKSGACQTLTFVLSNPTVNWTLDGGSTGITNNNNGSVTFDPTKLSAGNHVLQYSFNNGQGCTLTADAITFTTTGGPTITPATPLSVCAGTTSTTFTYTSTGTPTTYSIDWNAAANTTGFVDVVDAALSASPQTITLPAGATAGTYTGSLTVKNAGGCSSVPQNISVTISAGPSISGTTSMCVGETAQLNGTGTANSTNPWVSASALVASVNNTGLVTGLSAGTSVITYKDNNGCTATQTVTVNGNPIITANPTSILAAATSNISVSGGSGVAATLNPWVSSSTANATIVGAGQSATVTGVSAGNTNIIYTDNKGCDDTVQVTVTILGCKTINNPSSAQILCQGADPSAFTVSTSETAVNGINYVVYPAATKPANAAAVYAGVGTLGLSLSKVTPAAGVATLDLPTLGSVGSLPVVIAGDYYVYAILDPVPSDVNCRPYAEIKVTIKDSIIPVLNVTPVVGDSTVFSWTNDPTTSKWGLEGALTPTNAPPATWLNIGSVPNAAGGAINKHTTPSIPLGQTAHLKITPQDNTGTQLVCSNTASASITNPNCTTPIPLTLTAPTAVCEGGAITVVGGLDPLSVLANFKWRISTDGTNWSDVSGPDYDVTTVPSTILIATSKLAMNNALVKLVVTDKATGACKDSTASVKLLVNELPNATISINPDPALLCVGANQLITVTFLGNKGVGPYIFDYTLDGVSNTDSSLVGSSVLTYDFNTDNVINDSTFILTKVTDKNGCFKTINTNNTVKMQVIPAPVPVFTADQTVGCYPFTVIFTDKSTSLNTNVEWDFGDGSPVSKDLGFTKYTFKKAGDYTITFKSILNGCSDTMMKTSYIHVKDRPIAQFLPKKTNITMLDPEIHFINSSSNNAVSYKWVFGDGSPVSTLVNPVHTFIGQGDNDLPAPGKYVVQLYAYVNQDCWDSTSTTITIDDEQIYYIPNTFTPNGDEKNNTFQPVFTSGYDAQNYHFAIYDRWGELIFESNNPAIGWDGTYGNKILMNGTYTWKLQFKEKMTEKEHYLTGHVNLIK